MRRGRVQWAYTRRSNDKPFLMEPDYVRRSLWTHPNIGRMLRPNQPRYRRFSWQCRQLKTVKARDGTSTR